VLSSSELPPTALALACALVVTWLAALTLTSPAVVTERAMVACEVSYSKLSDTAAPTAASSLPSALPSVLVALVLRRSDVTLTAGRSARCRCRAGRCCPDS
jgi:hypothetical protein